MALGHVTDLREGQLPPTSRGFLLGSYLFLLEQTGVCKGLVGFCR